MSSNERERLRREASAMKLRAGRLRVFGDDADRAEAIVLLRRAAAAELAALDLLSAPSNEEQVGAIIEACGLFLEARDPVRAAKTWSRLPRWAFASDDGVAKLAEIRPRYEASTSEFIQDWRSLGSVSEAADARSLDRGKLLSILDKYAGVAELWWARSLDADGQVASGARARALELQPGIADESVARKAWTHIDEIFARMLKIELKAERPRDVLTLDLIGRIVTAVGALLSSFVDELAGDLVEPIQLVPRGAHSGSFVFDVSAHGLPPRALEDLDQALREMSPQVDAGAVLGLLALLQEHRVRLAVFVVPSPNQAPSGDEPKLVIDAHRRRSLTPKADAAARERIDSVAIPQANDLLRVFRVAELVANQEDVNAATLEVVPRQVSYYRRAAKLLTLLTESNELTASGRLIVRLGPDDRLRAAVVYFESSICGDAWIRWSKANTLLDVDPATAADFIKACVQGLSDETAERRAQTLASWHRSIVGHHYALKGAPNQVGAPSS